ncbi:MAG: hypothetical protein IKO61_07945, partial [Lachnospiraceae bacterium]|nr:hypothetical protein [Lachnospiraceae bacterium]
LEKKPGKSGNGYQNGKKAEKGSQNLEKKPGKSGNGYQNEKKEETSSKEGMNGGKKCEIEI